MQNTENRDVPPEQASSSSMGTRFILAICVVLLAVVSAGCGITDRVNNAREKVGKVTSLVGYATDVTPALADYVRGASAVQMRLSESQSASVGSATTLPQGGATPGVPPPIDPSTGSSSDGGPPAGAQPVPPDGMTIQQGRKLIRKARIRMEQTTPPDRLAQAHRDIVAAMKTSEAASARAEAAIKAKDDAAIAKASLDFANSQESLAKAVADVGSASGITLPGTDIDSIDVETGQGSSAPPTSSPPQSPPPPA